MKYFNLILIILLILPLTFAEEINLQKNKPIIFKEVQISLLTVGNSGTLRLKIQEQERLLEKYEELILYDIKFKNLESNYVSQSAKLSLDLHAECLVDEDCKESDPCRKSVCNHKNCEFSEIIPGCVFESECRSIGSFEDVNNKLSYCSGEGWKTRKSYKEECRHNYECLSNLCNNVCSTSLSGGRKLAKSWLIIIIGAILLAEGAFIFLKTKIAKLIMKNASFWSEKTWRIIAVIEILFAAALILWALL